MHDDLSEFQNQLDQTILDRIAEGSDQFDKLLHSLHGVYPVILRDSLSRLLSRGMISTEVLVNILNQSTANPRAGETGESLARKMPTPHPLDFDWRFSLQTTNNLLGMCLKLSGPGDLIVYLGCPSVFRISNGGLYQRRFLLFDKNPVYSQRWKSGHGCIHQDLTSVPIPELRAQVTLADPPWYQVHERSFLKAASNATAVSGFVLTTNPSIWTKPNVGKEWCSLLALSRQLGLEYLGMMNKCIEYDSPYFERNSLRAAGLGLVPKNWRQGDLAIFRKIGNPRMIESHTGYYYRDWSEETHLGFRIRNHGVQPSKSFRDPTLMSIIQGDILTSVSRTDPARGLADVWTEGNRIFACRGTHILQRILEALERGDSMRKAIASLTGRDLRMSELGIVNHTVRQIVSVINIETAERAWLRQS